MRCKTRSLRAPHAKATSAHVKGQRLAVQQVVPSTMASETAEVKYLTIISSVKEASTRV